jgi:hypothetical protein
MSTAVAEISSAASSLCRQLSAHARTAEESLAGDWDEFRNNNGAITGEVTENAIEIRKEGKQ